MWFKLLNGVLTHWRVVVALVALLVQSALIWQVQEWRWTGILEASEKASAEKAAETYRGALERLQQALAAADAANRRADAAIKRLKKDRDRWQTAYRAALSDSPECEAWAKESIKCPVPQS